MGLKSIVRGAAITAAGALVVTASTSGGPAAFAVDPDPGVSEVLAFLGDGGGPDSLAGWTSSLGTVGKLGQQLPLVNASPGALLGLDHLVSDAVVDELAGAETWAGLVKNGKTITYPGGSGTITTKAPDQGDGKRLDIDVTVTKKVAKQSLSLSNETPRVELSVKDGITVDITATLHLSVVWTGPDGNSVYLVADGAGPRLDVDVATSVDSATAEAAIGILGVDLAGSDLDLDAHFLARVNDPDGDGRLTFDEPGGSASDGELAPEGSLDGLVTAGFDPEGAGSLSASFRLGAASSGIAGLPMPASVDATIGVSWPDIAVGTPTVTAPDLAATVGKFQNMSLRDLADGLAQVVTSLTAIQKSKFDADGAGSGTALIGDLDLPFMKGTLSDAVQANSKLVDFLEKWVYQPAQPGSEPPGYDPTRVGQPKFDSLQELLAELESFAGIDLSNLSWDADTSKLAFTLKLTKDAPATPQNLDELSVKASGPGADYVANGLSVAGSPWKEGQWAGMRIVAGNSAGEIAGNTTSSLTLKSDWIGGQPADNQPFVIVGPEPHIGAVTFANTIQDSGHGLVNANADQTFAKVSPSYTTTVTLVLDLQDPKTGAACVGFEGNSKPCPFTQGDGPFATQVDSLPLNADRLMIRTGAPLIVADFPVETQVDFTANAGFFKVRVTGNLKACNSSQPADCSAGGSGHMLAVALKPQGDAQNDVRFSKLFGMLVKPEGQPSQASDLLDVDVNVRAYGALSVSVPEAETFLPGGATADFSATWNDLTKLSGADGPQLDTSDLAEIFKLDFDADNPQALFAIVIKTLQTLSKQLAEANPGAGGGVFDKDIPGLGRSLRDLMRSDDSNQGGSVSYGTSTLTDSSRTFGPEHTGRAVVVGTQVALVKGVQPGSGDHTLELVTPWGEKPAGGTAYMFRSPLDDALDVLLASPPDNLQDLVTMLNERLGNDALSFRYLESGGPNLVLDLDWDRSYRTSSPIKLALGNLGGNQQAFAGAEASGNATVGVSGNVDVGLVVPLALGSGPTDATSLKILADSNIGIHADASFEGNVKGVIGPLSIALGKPGGPAGTQAQARANVSLEFAKSGASASTPVSFKDFLSGADASFNKSNTPVTCGETLSTQLMVCGRLPLYVNSVGAADTWTEAGTIALRLENSTNAAALTTLSGNLPSPDTAKPRLEIPSDLGDRLLDAVLDFNNLGTGLDGYLLQIEKAFRVAAFNGKLPLIGEDLQQGADFIGDIRSTLQDSIWSQLPGGGRPADPSEVTDFLNDKLDDALKSAGMDVADLHADFDCTATLAAAAKPTVTPTTAAAGSTTWEYKVVAHQGSTADGNAGDTVPSPAGSTTTGAATLDAENYNTVAWAEVPGATGYKVLRKKQGESAFSLVALVTSGLQYVDKGQDTSTAYTAATTEPQLEPCPAEAIDGVTLEFTVRQGDVTPKEGCTNPAAPAKPCIEENIPLDIGIPGLALKAGPADDPDSNGISMALGYALHFKVGLSKAKGFYVNTHDGWAGTGNNQARPELQVGLGFDLPKEMLAELAFLQIRIDKHKGATGKLFAGAFQIDLKSPGEDSCWTGTEAAAACNGIDSKVLTFADLGTTDISDLFGISLKGTFDLDWDLVAEADSALPGVRANFKLGWEFDNNAPSAFGAPKIEFKDVGINAGAFFQDLLGPIVKEVKRVTGPITPVMDTLYAPIPVLSDLSKMAGGDDVTLVTLAKTFNTLADGPSLAFVDTVKAVVDFINRLPSCSKGDACFITIGSFTVSGPDALETSASPAAGSALISGHTAISGKDMKTAMNGNNDNVAAKDKPVFSTDSAKGDAEKSGFTFPIVEKPASAFSLLMGDDVTLVEFDSGPLSLGFSWRQSFGPVYAPPPVMVTLSGSASVTLRFMAGLDTAGIRHAVEALQGETPVEPIKVLDGLYFKTVDKDGKPVPVVKLDGEIAAGAAVTALIITVGIEGGLHLTIGFYWNDPNDDGKFRVSEFLQAAIMNPLCLFTTSGRLSLFLRVYITLGFDPFAVSFDFTLADVTLLDFTAQPDCSPPPPRLGGTTGTTLVVLAGDYGTETERGKPWGNTGADYDGDVVKVTALHFLQKPGDEQGEDADFDGFAIDMLGEHREYPDPNLQRVVVDGSGYDKPLLVTFVGDGKKEGDVPLSGGTGADLSVFDKDAIVFGGSGDDTIQTGTGKSYVDGGGGKDRIVTADTAAPGSFARVAGGEGDDTISTGHGDDRVAGDGSLGSATQTVTVTHNAVDAEHGGPSQILTGIIDWNALLDPTSGADSGSGNDTIGVGLGTNRVRGNGGDDKIGVAADAPDGSDTAGNNILIGGQGGDLITGGTGNDTVFTGEEGTFPVDAPGSADTAGKSNVVDTGSGNDIVWGSQIEDHVSSHSMTTQHAKLVGGGGADALMGGYGTDELYGGPGDDYVVAEPAKVGAQGATETIEGVSFGKRRSVEKLPLPSGTMPSTKTLVGGLGNDHILGGDGTAVIFGDTLRNKTAVAASDDETCRAGSPVTSDPVPEGTSAAGGDGNDLILGGAGVDTVSAGGGADRALTYGARDLVCGQEGADVLFGGPDRDHLWGGTGADRGYGEDGPDLVFGNAGSDILYGQAGADVLEGNAGSDWASGGDADDVVYGGSRAEDRDDAGDDLYGDTGNDRLMGDNGTVDDPASGSDAPAIPFDLDGAVASAGGGDRIHGGDGDDTAYGGLGDDVVNGNRHDDHLEGNNESDTVHGNDGEDEIVGGSFQEASNGVGRPDKGDVLYGDAGADLMAGDNAVLARVASEEAATSVTRQRGFLLRHGVTLLDLGDNPAAGTSGHDLISGGGDQDVVYGQGGDDRIKGDSEDDYAEGGPGTDWVEGNLGDDDLVGGSSTPMSGSRDGTSGQPDRQDALFGGPGDDVAIGDNGQVLRTAGLTPTRATVRLGSTLGETMTPRTVQMWDRSTGTGYLSAPSAARYGADQLSGGAGVDTLWGQDGDDVISGGADADYVEGNGGADLIRGDSAIDAVSARGLDRPILTNASWPGSGTPAEVRDGASAPDGQDDLIGGTATAGFRDSGDSVEGNSGDDVVLGDNGSLVRTLEGSAGSRTEKVYADRYPNGTVPSDATVSRTHDPALGDVSTRFCSEAAGHAATCDLIGAFGADRLYGDIGNDGMWGQDGNDLMYGGDGDDDLYGELGDDAMYGESGEDAMVGDRGGVVNQLLETGEGPNPFTISLQQPPKETYTGLPRGAYDRRVDLLHDVDGDTWIGASTAAPMPHDGITEGGRDTMRGGPDADNIHAGYGDDVANGDSGGDQVFGGDGEDVLWGGRGCDPVLDATNPECLTGGTFDPTARGFGDRMVDHLFGGVGESSTSKQELLGSDVLDVNPRGSYPGQCATGDWPATVGGVTRDPCLWFEMTDKHDADTANNNHHQGTDWIYGGWDRDVMQGDVAGNGYNPGDRLIDWNGAYNLYTHCNESYGGFNDIRLLAPDLHGFLTGLAWGSGAGRAASDVLTAGTSAYRELAFTYTADQKLHGTGKAYPTTPGHLEQTSCQD